MKKRFTCLQGLLPVMIAATVVTACQTVQTTQSGAVGIERKQMMMVSSKEMDLASSQSYHQILQQAGQKNALNRNREQVERVRAVARRLIPATGAFRSDAPGWQWEVNVLSSNELNAWCMAGGKMAPQFIDIVGLRKTAAHADDRDRFAQTCGAGHRHSAGRRRDLDALRRRCCRE